MHNTTDSLEFRDPGFNPLWFYALIIVGKFNLGKQLGAWVALGFIHFYVPWLKISVALSIGK